MLFLTCIDGAVVKPTLVDLIKSCSPHFEATIDKQEYLYHPTGPVAPIASAAGGEMTGIHDSHAEKAVDDDDRDNNEDSASPRKQQDSKRAGAKKKKRTKKSKQSAHEPSLKWRTLGLNPDDIEIPTMQRNIRTGKAQAQTDVAQRYDDEDQDFSSSESEYTSEEESQEKRQDIGMYHISSYNSSRAPSRVLSNPETSQVSSMRQPNRNHHRNLLVARF
jgi:hypothetical protein